MAYSKKLLNVYAKPPSFSFHLILRKPKNIVIHTPLSSSFNLASPLHFIGVTGGKYEIQII